MRMLAHDALTVARRILRDVIAADALTRSGHEAKGRAMLARLASEASAELPVIDGVLAAQTQAAEACHLTQLTPFGRLPLRERPEPHLHPANDQGPASEQPASPVA